MNSRSILSAVAFIIGLLAIATHGEARPRRSFDDVDVVERSELIVVGGIKDGSVVYVSHEDGGPDYMPTWEHHAVLVVHEVLKGQCKEKEIPIIFNEGLDPTVDGKFLCHSYTDFPVEKGAPPGEIRVRDINDSSSDNIGQIPDVRKDQIWLLRRGAGKFGEEKGKGDFRLYDPEDLQAGDMKEYFKCYLGPDVESAVRKQIARQPAVAKRGMRFLDLREIDRIGKISDAGERVQRLMPYFLNPATEWEAEKRILAAGPAVAGPYLLGVFDPWRERRVREKIINLWGLLRWDGSVDVLVDELQRIDRNWEWEIKKGHLIGPDGKFDFTEYREAWSSTARDCVRTLGAIGDPRAREAIEQTRRRWDSMNTGRPGASEECVAALKQIDAAEKN